MSKHAFNVFQSENRWKNEFYNYTNIICFKPPPLQNCNGYKERYTNVKIYHWNNKHTLLTLIERRKCSFPNKTIAENLLSNNAENVCWWYLKPEMFPFSLTTIIAFICKYIKIKLMENTPLIITVKKPNVLALQSLWHNYVWFLSEFEVQVCTEKSYRYDKQANYNSPHKRRDIHVFLWL